jgi:hypothetical protein
MHKSVFFPSTKNLDQQLQLKGLGHQVEDLAIVDMYGQIQALISVAGGFGFFERAPEVFHLINLFFQLMRTYVGFLCYWRNLEKLTASSRLF